MKRTITIIIFFLPFYFFLFTFYFGKVQAQTIDPALWQQQATGLKTTFTADTVNSYYKHTAGLSFLIQQQEWPFLKTQGGVKDSNSWQFQNTLLSTMTIDLGQIKIPGVTGAYLSEEADWAHDKINFSNLSLWSSRITPALLINSQGTALSFFSGNVTGNILNGTTPTTRTAGPIFPKYLAYSDGTTVQIQPLSTTAFTLPANQKWFLVWFGQTNGTAGSYFLDTKIPMTYNAVPWSYAYPADIPLLFVFENSPKTIKHGQEGGIEVSFDTNAGHASVLPLFGREHLRASDTENWKNGLPQNVTTLANSLSSYLCYFPEKVTESYDYNPATDMAQITEAFTYLPLCRGSGTKLAPLPPFLALAKDTLPISFSSSGSAVTPNNIQLSSEFGPLFGFPNSDSYTWSMSGLNKYVEGKRVLGTGPVSSELTQELEKQVNDVVADGHYAPWVFVEDVPTSPTLGDIYWANPADILYHLLNVYEALPQTSTAKANLKNYITSERTTYPPESIFDLNLSQGKARKNYSIYGDSMYQMSSWQQWWVADQTEKHLKRVSLYSFYPLSQYYEIFPEENLSPAIINSASNTLNVDMKERDWATFYHFKTFEEKRTAAENSNRLFAGLIGLGKLSDTYLKSNPQDATAMLLQQHAYPLLLKSAVAKVGSAKYTTFLYNAKVLELPSDPSWQAKFVSGSWNGFLINYQWSKGSDDHRVLADLNQFRIFLHDNYAFVKNAGELWGVALASGHLIGFVDCVPELYHFMGDYVLADTKVYLDKSEAQYPHWYMAFAEATLGFENNLAHPIDSFQLFLAKALLEKDTPQHLEKYADFSWLESGDLFYMHKLAETIKAYRGWVWADELAGTPTPTQGVPTGTPIPGDLDNSGQVGVSDLNTLLSIFGLGSTDGRFNPRADLDGSGGIGVIDLNGLLARFGR